MDTTEKQTSSPRRSQCYGAKSQRCTGAWGLAQKTKRFLVIVGISVGVIWFSVGCKSLSGNLEIDTPFFDIEYEGTPK